MSDTDRIGEEWIEHDRRQAVFYARLRRSLWAFGSGCAVMLVAVALRDKGIDAISTWYVAGLAGAVGMFVKSVDRD